MKTEYNVFLDTCCLIYALENGEESGKRARKLIDEYNNNGYSIYISPVSIMEFTAHDYINTKESLSSFINDNNISIVPIDEDVGYNAGERRCDSSIKSMDSLQLSVAQKLSPVEFVTNDFRLKKFENDLMKITIIEKTEDEEVK